MDDWKGWWERFRDIRADCVVDDDDDTSPYVGNSFQEKRPKAENDLSRIYLTPNLFVTWLNYK